MSRGLHGVKVGLYITKCPMSRKARNPHILEQKSFLNCIHACSVVQKPKCLFSKKSALNRKKMFMLLKDLCII